MLARWLSSGKESDFEGEEVHGYLPTPSEVPVSEIGDEFLTPRQLFDNPTAAGLVCRKSANMVANRNFLL